MYCQPQYTYPYEYQQYSPTTGYSIQAVTVPSYGSTSPYSPGSDRPSPSFRIEDILVQGKNAHLAGLSYPNGLSSSGDMHGHHRITHIPYQSPYGLTSQTMHSCGSPTDKDYPGMYYFKTRSRPYCVISSWSPCSLYTQ